MAGEGKGGGNRGVAAKTYFWVADTSYELRGFLTGQVLTVAAGFALGQEFAAFVRSIISDIVLPCIFQSGRANLKGRFVVIKQGDDATQVYKNVEEAQNAGAVTLNWGKTLDTFINFFFLGLGLFLVLKLLNCCQRSDPQYPCPRCGESVKLVADRCSHCCADPIAPPDEYLDDNRPLPKLPQIPDLPRVPKWRSKTPREENA